MDEILYCELRTPLNSTFQSSAALYRQTFSPVQRTSYWNFLNSKIKLSRNSIDSFRDILRKFSFDIHNFSFNKEAIMMKTEDNDYVYY